MIQWPDHSLGAIYQKGGNWCAEKYKIKDEDVTSNSAWPTWNSPREFLPHTTPSLTPRRHCDLARFPIMGGISGADRIISLFIACIATGMYFVSFVHCLRWLVCTDRGWRIRKRFDWTTLSATLALFVLSSIHTSLAVITTVEAIRKVEKGVGDSSDGKLSWTSVVMVSSFLWAFWRKCWIDLDSGNSVRWQILLSS